MSASVSIRRRLTRATLIELLAQTSIRWHHLRVAADGCPEAKRRFLSQTFNLIKGAVQFSEQGWNHWIVDRADYDVSLKRKVRREMLGELSEADLEILGDVHSKFGKMDQWKLVDYTHRYCREWVDPNGSSIPISYKNIFKALGHTSAEAKKLGARVELQRKIDRLFASF